MANFIVFLFSTGVGFGVRCIQAFMFIPMWKWVITPIFGLAVPGYWLMVGLLVILPLATLRISYDDVANSGDRTPSQLAVYSLISGVTHIIVTAVGFCALAIIF